MAVPAVLATFSVETPRFSEAVTWSSAEFCERSVWAME